MGTKVEEKVVEKVVFLRTPPGGAIWEEFGSIFGIFWEEFRSIWEGFWVELGLWFAHGLFVFLLLVYFGFACVLLPAGRFFVPFVCSLVSLFLPLCSRVPCVPFLLRASLSHATGERFGEHFAILAFAVLLVSSAPLRRFSVRACPYRCRKAPMRSMRWLLEVLLRRASSLVPGGEPSWHRTVSRATQIGF